MKKIVLFSLAVLFCLVVPKSFAQDVADIKKDNNLNQQEQVKTIFSFKDELGITDDQELKIKALLYDEQSFLDTNNASLKALGTDLSKLIADKADMKDIRSKLEDISKVQIEISYRNIKDSRDIETILTLDQIAKWKDIQKKFSAQAKG